MGEGESVGYKRVTSRSHLQR